MDGGALTAVTRKPKTTKELLAERRCRKDVHLDRNGRAGSYTKKQDDAPSKREPVDDDPTPERMTTDDRKWIDGAPG